MPDAPDGSKIPEWVTWIVGVGTFAGTVIAGAVAYIKNQKSDDNEDSKRYPKRVVFEAASLSDSRPIEKLSSLLEEVVDILGRFEQNAASLLTDIKKDTTSFRENQAKLVRIMEERMRLDEIKREVEKQVREQRGGIEDHAQTVRRKPTS